MEMKKRLLTLDLTRTISTLLIVLYHFNIQLGLHGINGGPIILHKFGRENIGSVGISLFIILSGAGLLYSNYDSLNLKHFYKKRIKTIFPIYYLTYFLTFIILFYVYRTIPILNSIKTFPLTVLGMDGFFYDLIPNCYLLGEWFIGFIIIFYIFFPYLREFVLYTKTKTKVIYGGIYAVIIVILIQTDTIQKIPFDPTRNPLVRLPEMLFGMEWAKATREGKRLFPSALSACISVIVFVLAAFVLKIHHIYTALLCGVSAFFILDVVANACQKISVMENVIHYLSIHSFAVILVHHNLIALIIKRFDGYTLDMVSLYTLFAFCLVAIAIAAFLITRLNQNMLTILESRGVAKACDP